jgi:hypothetical protein
MAEEEFEHGQDDLRQGDKNEIEYSEHANVGELNDSNKSIYSYTDKPLPPLSNEDKQRLQDFTITIKEGMKSFCATGSALKKIKEEKLYREIHKTFEKYVQSTFQMSPRRANQFISASEVIENLKQNGNNCPVLPINESQARVLASLPKEQQVEVWTKAVENSAGEVPTAKIVKETVNELCPPEITHKILVTSESQKICKAIETLSQFDVGQIRQAILDLRCHGIDLSTQVNELDKKFQNLELM